MRKNFPFIDIAQQGYIEADLADYDRFRDVFTPIVLQCQLVSGPLQSPANSRLRLVGAENTRYKCTSRLHTRTRSFKSI